MHYKHKHIVSSPSIHEDYTPFEELCDVELTLHFIEEGTSVHVGSLLNPGDSLISEGESLSFILIEMITLEGLNGCHNQQH